MTSGMYVGGAPAPTMAAMATCAPVLVDSPDMTPVASRSFDWFNAAAIATWLVCGVWPFVQMASGVFAAQAALVYIACFVAYGAAMIAILLQPRRAKRLSQPAAVALVGVQSVAAMAINAITVRYLHGTGAGLALPVIVAAELPYVVARAQAWTWIAVQTALLTALLAPQNVLESMTLGFAVGGFEVFAAASSFLAISEGRARSNLARANAELHATRSLLAESSRAEERLRIARDLHDTLGHHLTALSLQLDVASRLAEGPAADHLTQAHAITRLLLGDVRDVVSRTRDTAPVDVPNMLRALAGSVSGVDVRVDLPADLTIADAAQADAIVKTAQELVTNTLRHASARTLTISLAADGTALMLAACDDGNGARAVAWGNGLTGMRERFQQFGGDVEVRTAPGDGFEVRAVMPVRSPQ